MRPHRRHRGAGLAAFWLLALAGPAAARGAESLRVEVDGLSGELRRNVLGTLQIEDARGEKDLDEARIRRLHSGAPDEIARALQPFGRYRPVVKASLTHEGGAWLARYQVDPGPQLTVTSRDLRVEGVGAADPAFAQLVGAFPLRQGSPLNHLAYELGKKSFVDYAAENGYLDAAWSVNQIRIDLEAYTSDIVLHFTPGPRYHFGDVRFNQDFLRPELLRGYLTWRQGDPLSSAQLLRLQVALSASPYFRRVEVVPRRDLAAGDQVPIDVNLLPAEPQRWTAGAGYGTDTGPRGSLGLELRRLNEGGHRADFEGRLSLIEKSLKTEYILPGAYPSTDTLTLTAAYADLTPPTSKSRSLIVGPSLTQLVGRWHQSFSFDYTRTTYTVGLDSGVSTLVVPQASWLQVHADDRIYPFNGQKYELDVAAASKSVLSNASFAQAKASGKLVRSFGNRRFRILSRSEVAYTATHDLHLLPPTWRLFAGGDQSVRGYSFQGLGPRDAAGHVIGGQALVDASAELEYRVFEKWGVAAFFDAGNAAASFSSLTLKEGTGLGLRWLSPIGLVRADVAVAVAEPTHPIRFHLTVGPDL